jgi:hypothetical protein
VALALAGQYCEAGDLGRGVELTIISSRVDSEFSNFCPSARAIRMLAVQGAVPKAKANIKLGVTYQNLPYAARLVGESPT